MEAIEFLAVLILAGAIVVLIYFFLKHNAEFSDKLRAYVPTGTNVSKFYNGGENMNVNGTDETTNKDPWGEKIKGKFKDIDRPHINTDLFSKKIDLFLDEKSEELIKDWSLATQTDIKNLEKRCDKAYRNIDTLEKRFNEYRSYTNNKLERLDERLKVVEDKE
ncbi:hypothetical protein [Methanobrevibacter filiformis]|uniref:Uncharacterized protein n=1 Tax=Methanobrevibacter filiformis TaxID=55758 RepID=A0A166CFR8_9EURY|nr:hypothetical protein [Methanobrevibacter filiformis]KZX14459.1 hypothetical protein MBFIL_08560 [Methanobrevibacter filiformis]